MSPIADKRKGYHYLEKALRILTKYNNKNEIELLILGGINSKKRANGYFRVHNLGYIEDELELSKVYQAVDVMVLPSIQDNLPNAIMEALACGIPCVAFNIGGLSDLIEHKKNGYLAKPFDIEDLVTGIRYILNDQSRWKQLSNNSWQKVRLNYTQEIVAEKYLNIYQSPQATR